MAHDILIIDDEADIRLQISGILEDEGFGTRQGASSDAALEAMAARRPTLIILDVWLEGSRLDGIELLAELLKDAPEVPVIMISGHGTIEMAVTAIHAGAFDFIEKPFKIDRLLFVVERAIEDARLRREVAELRLRAGPQTALLGSSSGIKSLRQAIAKVAPTGSRVMISGPSGAGKEVVARQIHEGSRQANGPFVVVNCASIAPETMEIELFGSEAQPGDQGRRIGTFEQAHGGTLLLDEILDMPLATQAKILRVLQEQSFVRVGGTASVQVQVRVLASTSRDLQAAVAAGHFREELFYRLAVVPIDVPSLNARRDDIPELAEYFLGRAAQLNGRQPGKLTEDAMEQLQAYEWPGNVRELRNTMERMLIMAGDTDAIDTNALPPEITGMVATTPEQRTVDALRLPLRDAREQFERDYLLAQIERFGGNISRTAGFVGMERSALHRKLKSLGISIGNERT
jgi:two-component system, NtrC family, nitrogen regulation response regulator NtrX